MKVFYKVIGEQSQVELMFENPEEEILIFEGLRSGFINQEEREKSRLWSSIEENRQEINNAFTQAWLLRDIAIYSEKKDFDDMLKNNKNFVNVFKSFSLETSKLILVFISSLSNTKFKGERTSSEMNKRLSVFKSILKESVGPSFKYKDIKLPKMNVTNY